MRTLEIFAFRAIGDLVVSEVTGPMMRDLLACTDVPSFLSRLRGATVTFGRLALDTLILTATRSGEVRGAG